MSQFNQLGPMLDELALKAAQLDRLRGEHHQPLFDEHLFHCKARLIVPCVQEAKSTFTTIIREQKNQRLTATRAEYLTEVLLAQIGAIQRELATKNIRRVEIKHSSHYRKPINALYDEYGQHKEWTRRLQELVLQKQNELAKAPVFHQQAAQQALLVAEQRLERCEAAMLKIENKIHHREKNQ
ncbi:prepilin peptidase [Vibrio sp. 10N.286.49.B3]|uniref:primosomal replication protein n=1 Tax=Vibrio sp. 10N.286.49.B3 TaxID=1880855 RepID=UPI000C83FB30|nr:primosomal replication protein [Vibrio sp. 10N.286.49.B3]PMH44982.1 prepilin peptidase [Vibrio sp. 10N.286.49.B3]